MLMRGPRWPSVSRSLCRLFATYGWSKAAPPTVRFSRKKEPIRSGWESGPCLLGPLCRAQRLTQCHFECASEHMVDQVSTPPRCDAIEQYPSLRPIARGPPRSRDKPADTSAYLHVEIVGASGGEEVSIKWVDGIPLKRDR